MVRNHRMQVNKRCEDSKDRLRVERGNREGATLDTLLASSGGQVHIACDTEFDGPHTLTAQFAARVKDDILVQVYRSPAVPDLPADFDLDDFLPDELRNRYGKVILRPVKTLSSKLSPVRVLADL